MAKKIGYTVREYRCMPIGELQDLIDLHMASKGAVKLTEARRNGNEYIPTNLR